MAEVPTEEQEIDVALSFASEQRWYVDAVNRHLIDVGVKVFYDENETAELWGAQGTERFTQKYGAEAFRVVMFISDDYVRKGWPTVERRAALGRLIEDPDSDHILPVRFDDTPVPGLDNQRIFVRANEYEPVDLAGLIVEHLVKSGRLPPDTLEREGFRMGQARLVSFTSIVSESAGTWTCRYRIENTSDSAIDGVVVAVADPGAPDCSPANQFGCALEVVIGVVGPGQVIEDSTELFLTGEPAFVELPYLASLLWTDVDGFHWMANGATLSRRSLRARTC